MVTPEERREAAWTRAKTRLESYYHAKEMAKTLGRAQSQKARAARRRQVGKLAEQHGLTHWADSDLTALFQLLAQLRDTPNPAGVLAGLLCDTGDAHVSSGRSGAPGG